MAARTLVALSFAGFVALGMPEGATGVAWPSMSAAFGRPISQLGVVIGALVVGYLGASAASGHLSRAIGIGPVLTASSVLSAIALAGLATSPAWAVVLASMAVLGLGAGLVDSGLNAHTSLTGGARRMNLLHACFGIGATVGPVVMTLFLGSDGGWRWAYGVFALVHVGLAASFWATRHRWVADADPGGADAARIGRVVVLSLLAFVLYTGAEVAAGQWAFTVLTEGREVPTGVAGVWVGGYWASLTAGRLLAGALGGRVGPTTMLVSGMATAMVGTLLFWWEPTTALGGVGLWVIGLGLAPVFPVMVLLTPERVGRSRSEAVIGYQLAAASIGAAIVPGAIGWIVGVRGLDAVAPALAVTALAMVAAVEAARRVRPRTS